LLLLLGSVRGDVAAAATPVATSRTTSAPTRRVVRRARPALADGRLPAVVPPMRVTPDRAPDAMAFASPSVAPLPAAALRYRGGVLVPSARAGFVRAAPGPVGGGAAAAGAIGGVVRAVPRPPA